MSRIRPLTSSEARGTIVHRIAPVVDRARQRVTEVGLRPYHVFLTWVVWVTADARGNPKVTGKLVDERGQGAEKLLGRIEILPNPRVTSLDGVSLSPMGAGIVPMGSVRVDRISALYTRDTLMGLALPCDALPFGEEKAEKHLPDPYEFFYEIVEDGRGDDPAKRMKFRRMTEPQRRAGKSDWTIMLERMGEDRTREDESAIGKGVE